MKCAKDVVVFIVNAIRAVAGKCGITDIWRDGLAIRVRILFGESKKKVNKNEMVSEVIS